MPLEKIKKLKDTVYQIQRMNDGEVFARIKSLASSSSLTVSETVIEFTFCDDRVNYDSLPQDSQLEQVMPPDGIVAKVFAFTLSNQISIVIERTWDHQSLKLAGNTDNVRVKARQPENPSPSYVLEYSRTCVLARRHFRAVDTRTYIDYLDDASKALLDAKERDLQKLQQTILGLTGQLADFTIGQEKKHADFQAALQRDYAERKATLEKIQQEKTQVLEQEREDLRKLRQEIDDRDNQTARRAIYEDIKKKIEARNEEFELTKGTQKRSWWPFGIAATLLVVFGMGYGFCLSLNANPPNGVPNLSLLSSQISFAIAFLSTAIYLVRSTHQWFQKHAVEEFRLKRIDLDIDRANWLVELALEWSKISSGGQFPPELIDRLSRSLFMSEDAKENGPHPADTLMAALGKVTRVEANAAGCRYVIEQGADGKKPKADN